MSKTNPARGMRDFLPADVRKREYVIGIIKEVYESYGFEPLETPAVENLETLMGKYGEEGNQLIFKILKRRDKFESELKRLESAKQNSTDFDVDRVVNLENMFSDTALRYDLTVPLARVVANNRNELPKFFKRYQIQPVWRADRPAKGRYREFYQCDVDAIGTTSMVVEVELISAVSEVLERLGFDDFVIRINHREVLNKILACSGVPEDKTNDALIALDKIDKIGREGVEREFKERGLLNEPAMKLAAFLGLFLKDKPKAMLNEKARFALASFMSRLTKSQSITLSTIDEMLQEANEDGTVSDRSIVEMLAEILPKDVDSRVFQKATRSAEFFMRNIYDLGEIADFISDAEPEFQNPLNELHRVLSNIPVANVRVDPTLARGLSYYTGAIFEINVPDLAGSLGGGGRYDGLIGMFGKEQIPACGFSLGLERILVVMEERGMFPPEIADSTPADVMVTIWSEETVAGSLKLAADLRSAGLRVTVYPEPDKLGKQIKYADQINVPYVCVLGETEIAEGTVTLKNMKTGEQEAVDRDQLVQAVSHKL